jgi:hypothetical protein
MDGATEEMLHMWMRCEYSSGGGVLPYVVAPEGSQTAGGHPRSGSMSVSFMGAADRKKDDLGAFTKHYEMKKDS